MSEISCKEAGRRGGRRTVEKYGLDHYRRIGARGGQTTKERWGAMMSEWAKAGGGRPRGVTLGDTAGTGQ